MVRGGPRRDGLASARRAAGYTQESLAAELHIDRSTVVRWEAGDHTPLPYIYPKLAHLLGQSREQLSKLIDGPVLGVEHDPHLSGEIDVASQDGKRRVDARLVAQPAVPAPPSMPVLGNGVFASGSAYSSAIQSFRAADRQVGGGHLYATVVKYLHVEVAPRLFGVDHDGDGQLAFTAAAALTDMAGWMAHDAGLDQAAEQHLARSLDLVKIGGDRQLGVHVLAGMSHLALHRGRPTDAVHLARRGQAALSRGPQHPELEARLLAMQARGFAALNRIKDCAQLLVQAERVLAVTPAKERSPWVSRFDEGSLASEAARCLRQLGDLAQAQRQAERIIELRPGDRTRSRALGQLMLVTVLIAQGKPDQACALTHQVLDATPQLGSYLVIQQLRDLKPLLEPYRSNRIVADFLVCLDTTLRERVGLYQWLAKDGRGQATELGER
jgi:transcriptional regulator with XRE-family HTH domain